MLIAGYAGYTGYACYACSSDCRHCRQMSSAATLQSLHVKRPVNGKQHWQPSLGTLNARVCSRFADVKPQLLVPRFLVKLVKRVLLEALCTFAIICTRAPRAPRAGLRTSSLRSTQPAIQCHQCLQQVRLKHRVLLLWMRNRLQFPLP